MKILRLLIILSLVTLTAKAQNEIKTVPYTMGFEYGETDGIQIVDVNGKTGSNGVWKIKWYTGASLLDLDYSNTGIGALVYFYDSKRAADDWAFLDPIQMKAGKYCVRFYYCNQSNITDYGRIPHPERVSLSYGQAATPESMTTEVVRYDPFDVDQYTESTSIINIPEEGVYYFGFHAFSDKDENVLMIDDVSITAIENEDNDIAIDTLAEPAHGIACPKYQDLMFRVKNLGAVSTDCTITVTVDDNAEPTEIDRVTLAAQSSYDEEYIKWFTNLTPGRHKLTIRVTNDDTTDPAPDDNTLVREVEVLGDYTHRWDAEGGQVDNDLTMRCYDKKTLDSSLESEFPDGATWNVTNIEAHDIYGQWMYECGTWFTDEVPTPCDRWLILPPTKVNADDAYFTWIAGSMSSKYLENYSVAVSTTDAAKSSFTTLYTVNGENGISDGRLQPRGISLSPYVGKTIRLALHVTTADGELAIFDNLSLYGDVTVEEYSPVAAVHQADKPSDGIIYNLAGQRIGSLQKGMNIVNGQKVLR